MVRKGFKMAKFGDSASASEVLDHQRGLHPEKKAQAETKKAVEKKLKRIDGKTFHFIVWEKSASPDWMDRLSSSMLPFCISPRHDSDIAGKDDVMEHEEGRVTEGVLIDPHFHVMVQWGNTTTLSNVRQIIMDLLNDENYHPVNTVFKTLSPAGMYAYLTHSNREKKHQYEESDIKLLNGFSVTELLLNKDSSAMAMKIIGDYRQYKWKGYSKALMYYMDCGEIHEFEYLRCNVAFFTSFFRSENDCKMVDLKEKEANAKAETAEFLAKFGNDAPTFLKRSVDK